MIDLHKHQDETETQFIWRLGSAKDSGILNITWQDLAHIFNQELRDEDEEWTECAYRKKYQQAKMFYDEVFSKLNNESKTSLDEIRDLIGEQYLLKRQLQNENREINKVKRDFVKSISIAEDVIRFFKNDGFRIDISEIPSREKNTDMQKNIMVCVVGDWHIGYKIVNCKGNYFNWNVANDRLNKYLDECYKLIELYKVDTVYVINVGDMIEGCYMRQTQSQYCEFLQGEQIARFTTLMFRFLHELSLKADVIYDAIAGNHDRYNGDKTQNLDGDNLNSTTTPILKYMFGLVENKHVIIKNREYSDKEIVLNINGLIGKFVHGHDHTKDDKNKIKNEMSMDNCFYDFYVEGHWHNFRCLSENNGRYLITNGCLSGYNDYSTAFGCATNASQTIMIIGQNKIELIKDVQL